MRHKEQELDKQQEAKLAEKVHLLKTKGWHILNELSAKSLVNRHGVECFGDYNTPPTGFREIPEAEMAVSNYPIYSTVMMAFRQLKWTSPEGKPELLSMWINVTPIGHGFGYYRDYWAKRIRWFIFEACKHEFRTVKSMMCYKELQCITCGFEYSIDSSD